MSRSYRRTPSGGHSTAASERADKKSWHSRLRAATARALSRGDDVMPQERDVSDPWTMAKDGKTYRPAGEDAERRLAATLRREDRGVLLPGGAELDGDGAPETGPRS